MQAIAGSLILGVVIFAALTLLLGTWNQPQQAGPLKYIGLLLVVVGTVPFFVIPSLIKPSNMAGDLAEGTASNDRAPSTLLGLYQTRMILRFALLEGAVFMNLIAFLAEHARWSFAVAGGLTLIMLVMFPTRTRVEQWVETQQLL